MMKNTLCIFALLCFHYLALAESSDFESLFDGKTLNGWSPAPGGKWVVKDGAIVGTSPKTERRHGMLLTNKQFTNFIVKAKFRVHSGDSGFYFRAKRVKTAVSVHGFQVEVDTTQETGGLYETRGRGWVVKPTKEVIKKRAYKSGEWTNLELSAIGGNIIVKINGFVSSELKNDRGRLKGYFGLQLHGGVDMHVEYKDIMIRTIESPEE